METDDDSPLKYNKMVLKIAPQNKGRGNCAIWYGSTLNVIFEVGLSHGIFDSSTTQTEVPTTYPKFPSSTQPGFELGVSRLQKSVPEYLFIKTHLEYSTSFRKCWIKYCSHIPVVNMPCSPV